MILADYKAKHAKAMTNGGRALVGLEWLRSLHDDEHRLGLAVFNGIAGTIEELHAYERKAARYLYSLPNSL